jgi:cytochrome c biogenesis protein
VLSLRDLTNTFANVLFAVSLFAIWGVMTLIGVVVDQGKDASFYLSNYAPALARVVLRLHFDNIYHSPQYVGIIGLILCSLAVCTFKRVIPARLPPLRAVKIEHIPLNATLYVRGSEASVRERLERFLRGRGWQVRKREIGGVEWTFADRHNWARRGVLVAHAGFVIIAAGTTLYWLKGFSGESTVLTGQAITIPQTNARIALDRFRYEIQPITTKGGTVYQPTDYVSDVHVTGRDGVTRTATIRVNHPIDIDGTNYYQASYGYGVNLAVTKDGKPVAGIPAHPLTEGEGFALGATSGSIQYAQFVGTIDRATHQPAADPRPNDPGVLLNIYNGDQLAGRVLAPFGESLDLGDGFRVEPQRYTLYSGLQYRYDPGVPLVGIGAFVLLSGLCIAFYLLPARLYVRVDRDEHAWRVRLAATTVKGYDIFEEQFGELVEALGQSEQPPSPRGAGAQVESPA